MAMFLKFERNESTAIHVVRDKNSRLTVLIVATVVVVRQRSLVDKH